MQTKFEDFYAEDIQNQKSQHITQNIASSKTLPPAHGRHNTTRLLMVSYGVNKPTHHGVIYSHGDRVVNTRVSSLRGGHELCILWVNMKKAPLLYRFSLFLNVVRQK